MNTQQHEITLHDTPLFTILIPSWNNLELLQLCIQSILKNSTYKHQIVVHANEGSDGTTNWLSEQQIAFTHSLENVGVCAALNMAAQKATTNYICYINDDMYLCPKWDSYLWDEIKGYNSELFYFSMTAIEPLDVGKKCGIFPYSYGRDVANFEEKRLLTEFENYTYHDWNGASWPPAIVHRNTWQKVNGYSTEFFPGFYSDPDFSMKLWKIGVRNFKGISKSRCYHFLEKSTRKIYNTNVKDARYLFLRKWGISANAFYTFYLRMGTPNNGELTEPKKSFKFIVKIVLTKIKLLFI